VKVCSGSSSGSRSFEMQACYHSNEVNVDLWFDDSHAFDNRGRYRKLIGKLIYLTVTMPDITFTIRVLSRFMHQRTERDSLVSCDKGSGLHQELSKKKISV